MSQILNVPFVSRYGTGEERLDCGACCVAMLLEAMAQAVPAQDIAAASQASGRLSAAAIIRGADAFGLTMFQNKGLALDDLKRLIDDGQPPIALLKYGSIPDRLERRHTGGHYVVVVGYDDWAGLVFINDPHYPKAGQGGSDGYQRPYAYQAFLDAWGGQGFELLVPVPMPAPAPPEEGISFELPTSLGDVWVVAPLGLRLRPQPDASAAAVLGSVSFGQRLSMLGQESKPDANRWAGGQLVPGRARSHPGRLETRYLCHGTDRARPGCTSAIFQRAVADAHDAAPGCHALCGGQGLAG